MNDLEKAVKIISENKWIFAKTMPWIPHWYCLRKNYADDKDFVWLVQYIRANGMEQRFGSRTFVYLYLNDYKYWTMGEEINKDGQWHTILINRDKYKKTIDETPYEQMDMFEAIEKDNTLELVLDKLGDLSEKSVLDIRCGDASFKASAKVKSYVGIDNRKEHLLHARRNNPEIELYLDSVRNMYLGEFDVIISLYGEASYLGEEDVNRLLAMAGSDTVIYLMYKNHLPCRNELLLDNMKSEVIGNYQIITNI